MGLQNHIWKDQSEGVEVLTAWIIDLCSGPLLIRNSECAPDMSAKCACNPPAWVGCGPAKCCAEAKRRVLAGWWLEAGCFANGIHYPLTVKPSQYNYWVRLKSETQVRADMADYKRGAEAGDTHHSGHSFTQLIGHHTDNDLLSSDWLSATQEHISFTVCELVHHHQGERTNLIGTYLEPATFETRWPEDDSISLFVRTSCGQLEEHTIEDGEELSEYKVWCLAPLSPNEQLSDHTAAADTTDDSSLQVIKPVVERMLNGDRCEPVTPALYSSTLLTPSLHSSPPPEACLPLCPTSECAAPQILSTDGLLPEPPLRVMVSYVVGCTGKHGDQTALRVRDALLADGVCEVMLDTDCIEPGGNWGVTINQMVLCCDVLVPIVSEGFAVLRGADKPNSGQSWTLREVQSADREGKLLIPLYHSGPWPPTNLTCELGPCQHIQISGGQFDDGMKKLLARLHSQTLARRSKNQEHNQSDAERASRCRGKSVTSSCDDATAAVAADGARGGVSWLNLHWQLVLGSAFAVAAISCACQMIVKCHTKDAASRQVGQLC